MTAETRAAAAMLNTIVKERRSAGHWSDEDWANLHEQFHRLWERERVRLHEQRLVVQAWLDTLVFVIASLSWVIVWWLLEQW